MISGHIGKGEQGRMILKEDLDRNIFKTKKHCRIKTCSDEFVGGNMPFTRA